MLLGHWGVSDLPNPRFKQCGIYMGKELAVGETAKNMYRQFQVDKGTVTHVVFHTVVFPTVIDPAQQKQAEGMDPFRDLKKSWKADQTITWK